METVEIKIADRVMQLKTSEPEKLASSVHWLNLKLDELLSEKPKAKSSDLQILLLLQMAIEREELKEQGKALLTRADELIEWVSSKMKTS